MSKPCPHGSLLPRGLRCDRGYLILRLKTDQGPYNRGCGPHTPGMEKAARLALEDIRVRQKLGTFNIPSKLATIKFKDAFPIYHKLHFVEYRNPKTKKPRSAVSTEVAMSHLRALNSFLSEFDLHAIGLKALLAYRKKRVEYDGVSNGTVNRDMAVLSSLIHMFRVWVEADIINAVKLPVNKDGAAHNPCELLEDLEELPRQIDYDYKDAIGRLYQACKEIKDQGMWAIIETELDTTLRKNDLETYFALEKTNGFVTMMQSKTGTNVSLPEMRHPNWANVFVNFDSRWEKVRAAAGFPQMWFRDLRKIGMLLLEELGHSPEAISMTAGHSSSAITKKWYLSGRHDAEKNRPLIEARRQLIEEIKEKSKWNTGIPGV